MKKRLLKTLGVVVLIIPLLGMVLACEQAANFFAPSPPRPEITYGEFPFRVEYEKNGERIVVEDTIICRFDGFVVSRGGSGKMRRWKSSFASGRAIFIEMGLMVDDTNQIFLYIGEARNYMGDGGGGESPPKCRAYKYLDSLVGGHSLGRIDSDELFSTYGIKVISHEFSHPIVNIFK